MIGRTWEQSLEETPRSLVAPDKQGPADLKHSISHIKYIQRLTYIGIHIYIYIYPPAPACQGPPGCEEYWPIADSKSFQSFKSQVDSQVFN